MTTDPTADAAKLLPSLNTDVQIYHTPPNSVYDDSIHVTQDGSIGINVAGHVIVKPLREWHALANTRPQPAPPAGEPEPPFDQIAENLAYGGPRIPNSGGKADTDWIKTRIAEELKNVYRLGLATRPKIEDAEVVALCKELRLDGAPLGDIRAGNSNCLKAADLLERLANELKRWKTTHTEICSAIIHAGMPSFDTATNGIKGLGAKLAEREAELAKADAALAIMDDFVQPNIDWEKWIGEAFEEAQGRHAARQQQKASAEKGKP